MVEQLLATTTADASTHCWCCDDWGYQFRNDGVRVPCPGCAGGEKVVGPTYPAVPTYPTYPVFPPYWPAEIAELSGAAPMYVPWGPYLEW